MWFQTPSKMFLQPPSLRVSSLTILSQPQPFSEIPFLRESPLPLPLPLPIYLPISSSSRLLQDLLIDFVEVAVDFLHGSGEFCPCELWRSKHKQVGRICSPRICSLTLALGACSSKSNALQFSMVGLSESNFVTDRYLFVAFFPQI